MAMLLLLPSTITYIHKEDTMISDGMALVQSIQPHSEHLTFKNMAEELMNHSWKKTDVKTFILFLKVKQQQLKTHTMDRRGNF